MNSPILSKVLVLGASGQVGAAICTQLAGRVVPAGRNPPADSWLQLDLSSLPSVVELKELIAREQFTAIVCSAGATDVERCESDITWAEAANHFGPGTLASVSKELRLPFVFFSTDYVFDGEAGPYAEEASPNPLSVYGRTKRDGEQEVLATHPEALVLRTTAVFGPDAQRKNFLYTLRRLLSEAKPIRLPTDQFATPTYNADLAAATVALLEGGYAGLFHIAGADLLSRVEFARLACDLLGLDKGLITSVSTSELGQKARRPLAGGLRCEKLRRALPGFSLHSTAAGILEWNTMVQSGEKLPL